MNVGWEGHVNGQYEVRNGWNDNSNCLLGNLEPSRSSWGFALLTMLAGMGALWP
jgi:hypothetical protein